MIPKEPLFRNLRRLEPFILPAIVVLVGVGAFGLGRLSAVPGHQALRIIYPQAQLATPTSAAQLSEKVVPKTTQTSGQFVASKTGAKYYPTTCSGANRIKDENKVYFSSATEAQAAGYEPAANCPGI